jgi:hypothetical protein
VEFQFILVLKDLRQICFVLLVILHTTFLWIAKPPTRLAVIAAMGFVLLMCQEYRRPGLAGWTYLLLPQRLQLFRLFW